MIKTTELMLGNLIEHDGKYHVVEGIGKAHISVSVGNISSEYINPIPLTEGVLKRLKLGECTVDEYSNHGIDYVHELQIDFYLAPIDITPLLSPRYTTHDGVEVWEGDEVWCYEYLRGVIAVKCDSTIDPKLHFSTQQACQSYIDSVTRKPIFTTEDGVDVFEGDSYWFVGKNGMTPGKDKDILHWNYCTEGSGKLSAYAYFSTKQLAQAYLNKVWAEKEYNDLLNTPRK